MKRTLLQLVLAITVMCSSLSLHAQSDVGLTMTFRNEPLVYVFQRLENASPYKFLFTYDDVTKYNVDFKVTNANVIEVLKQALKNTDLDYKIDGKFINIVKRQSRQPQGKAEAAPVQTVGGYVVEKGTGEPIIGAQVRVVGTQVVTVTDVNGAFSFDYYLKPGQQVEFSYVGMKTLRVPIAREMRIHMESDTKELAGVVVTGIFQKAKESYTGAVSSIDRGKLDMYKGTNLVQTLKNIDASINFPLNNLAGSNPNVLPNLNIRGTSSLPMSVEEFNKSAQQTVNTPLIIMDGFEISLTKLMDYNDEQIESINILKDAAATAIYGSRGANGVIVIITKTPKEGKLRVTAKAGLSLEIPDLSTYDLLNAAEKLDLERRIGLYTDTYHPDVQLRLNSYYADRLKAVKSGTDIDWLSKPLRNGVGQRYNIQLDGGANEFKWGASLGYNDIEGAMKGSSRRTLTGDITLLYSVKNLTFRNYTSIAANRSRESKYGSFQTYVDMEPYNNPYDANGNVVKDFPAFDYTQTRVGNPLYDATLNSFDKSEYFEFMNNFSVEWLIIDGLRMRAKLGVSTHRSTSDLFYPAEHSMFNTADYLTASGALRKGRYTYGNGHDNLLSGDLTLSYTKTFREKHQLYLGANYAISDEKVGMKQFVAEGFTNEDLSSIGNALQYQQNGTPLSDDTTIRLVGLTGNANYTYDGRYYVDLSYRVDGSSKFGSDKRFAPFWSAGIGWNVHNEKWLYGNKVLNMLRLKASYGLTGSQDFATQSVYTTYKYAQGGRYMGWTAAQMLGLGNPNLTWQKTKEINAGLEFGLFHNRIVAQIDYYNKKTSNLLSAMDLPLSTGFASYTANVGELENNGVEASLNAYIIRNEEQRFNVMVGGQLVYNRNKIVKLSDAIIEQNKLYMAQNVDVSNLFFVGRPMNAIYAVQSAGIDPSTGEEVFYDKNGQVTSRWSASDKVYLGASEPLYRGNFNAMVMWKNFTFNASFGYHWGGKLYNSTLRDRVEVSVYTIQEKNVDRRVLYDRWMKPGDVSFFKNFSTMDTRATSRYVFDDRMLELQSLSLQYRWNTKWLQQHTKLESVIFAVNASDLFYLSSVKYERGTSYPFARNVMGTVTLTF